MHDDLFPKEEVVLKKTLIIYNRLQETLQYTTWILPMNGES